MIVILTSLELGTFKILQMFRIVFEPMEPVIAEEDQNHIIKILLVYCCFQQKIVKMKPICYPSFQVNFKDFDLIEILGCGTVGLIQYEVKPRLFIRDTLSKQDFFPRSAQLFDHKMTNSKTATNPFICNPFILFNWLKNRTPYMRDIQLETPNCQPQ